MSVVPETIGKYQSPWLIMDVIVKRNHDPRWYWWANTTSLIWKQCTAAVLIYSDR